MFKGMVSNLGKTAAKAVVGAAMDVKDEIVGVQEVADGNAGVKQILEGKVELQVKQVSQSDCDICQVCCFCCNNCCNECKGEHGNFAFPCCCCKGGAVFRINDSYGHALMEVAEDTPEGCRAFERVCCSGCQSTILRFKQHKTNKVLLTVERQGLSLGKCVCCFSCCDCCNDGFSVYEGNVDGLPGELQNAPSMHTMITQPIGGGGFIPTLDIEPKTGDGSQAKIEGPTIFGGCADLCSDGEFTVSSGNEKPGKIATLTHLKPKDGCDLLCALCTKIDKYDVKFNSGAGSADKVNTLVGSILVDLTYFERDDGPIGCGGDDIYFNLFFCSCCGCLCPCQLRGLCPNKNE